MKKDIDNMQYLAENMMGRTFCPLGDAAAMPTMSLSKKSAKNLRTTWTASRVRLKQKAKIA